MIKKTGSQYTLYSKDGSKRLSNPSSLEQAKKRERQVQYFKHTEKAFDQDVPKVDISAASDTLRVEADRGAQANRINQGDAYKSVKKSADDGQGYHPEFQEGPPSFDRGLMQQAREGLKDKKGDVYKGEIYPGNEDNWHRIDRTFREKATEIMAKLHKNR